VILRKLSGCQHAEQVSVDASPLKCMPPP